MDPQLTYLVLRTDEGQTYAFVYDNTEKSFKRLMIELRDRFKAMSTG